MFILSSFLNYNIWIETEVYSKCVCIYLATVENTFLRSREASKYSGGELG